MTLKEFERLVEEGFVRLPEWVRKKISNVAIIIADEPTPTQRKEMKLTGDETLLGLYHGVPLSARDTHYGVGITLPDSIIFFQKPIEEAAQGEMGRIRDIVADTIWHEFAHHFGIDEEGVRAREEKRGIGDFRKWGA